MGSNDFLLGIVALGAIGIGGYFLYKKLGLGDDSPNTTTTIIEDRYPDIVYEDRYPDYYYYNSYPLTRVYPYSYAYPFNTAPPLYTGPYYPWTNTPRPSDGGGTQSPPTPTPTPSPAPTPTPAPTPEAIMQNYFESWY